MPTAPADVDYAHTRTAEKNRAAKATALARDADVQPPSEGSPTWEQAARFLAEYTAFAAANPGHPKLMAQDLADAPTTPTVPLPREPDAPTPVARPTPAPGLHVPKGWDTLAALPVLTHAGARCFVCAAPAVIGTAGGFRCTAHPPQRGQWGATLDWTWRERACLASRCYCGRHEHYAVPA